MSDKPTYVHKYTLTLEVIPLLAQGSNAVIFDIIGLLEPEHPEGVTEQDISKYYRRGLATIRAALASLQSNGLLEMASEGCYRTNPHYMCWGKRAKDTPLTLPEPVSESAGVANNYLQQNNIFAPHDDDVLNELDIENSFEEHPYMHEAKNETREILADWIEGVNLERLAAKVSPQIARLWADWLAACDRKQWRNPAGYCWGKLSANPSAKPPYVKGASAPKIRKPTITGHLAV